MASDSFRYNSRYSYTIVIVILLIVKKYVRTFLYVSLYGLRRSLSPRLLATHEAFLALRTCMRERKKKTGRKREIENVSLLHILFSSLTVGTRAGGSFPLSCSRTARARTGNDEPASSGRDGHRSPLPADRRETRRLDLASRHVSFYLRAYSRRNFIRDRPRRTD